MGVWLGQGEGCEKVVMDDKKKRRKKGRQGNKEKKREGMGRAQKTKTKSRP